MSGIGRSVAAAALSGTVLLATGCGTSSGARQAAAPASVSASPSAAASSPPASAGPSPSSSAAPLCTPAAPAGVYTAPGVPIPVPPLAAVEFVSPSRGWVAGAGRVLATSDGGQTWTRQYSGPAGLDQVDFIDAQHGWAVGTNALLRTTDGGATWTRLSDPCGSLRSVHFATPDLGYAVAGGSQVRIDGGVPAPVIGGELLRTTDGGRGWTPVAGAPAQAQTACFATAADGFVGTPGKVWRTSDGGQHWSLAFTEPVLSAGVQPGSPDTTVLECAGIGTAWVLFLGIGAALSHAPYLAYAIQDARNVHVLFEESYTESAARPEVRAPDGPGSYPGPFSAISPDEAAFVGWDPPVGYGAAPLVTVTGSGSVLSRPGYVGGLTQALGAAFISPSQGWVVGTDQTQPGRRGGYVIQATSDGGHTWTRQYQIP
jgi:photosystem II stability/assembly factor-like uncharacterized protein